MIENTFIFTPYTARSFFADLITPERAEELAGDRAVIAAQFHRLWSDVRDPYVKEDWNRLRGLLCDLRVDADGPSYVARSRQELRRRLGRLRAERQRVTRSRTFAVWGLLLVFAVNGYLHGPYKSSWQTNSLLAAVIIAYLLWGAMITRQLREVRFRLALFCRVCGEPLTGGSDGQRERDVMKSGKCPHCKHVLLDQPDEATA
jgi:hypothetical protein